MFIHLAFSEPGFSIQYDQDIPRSSKASSHFERSTRAEGQPDAQAEASGERHSASESYRGA